MKIIILEKKRKLIKVTPFFITLILVFIFGFVHAENGGYNVQTTLTPPSQVETIKDATNNSFKTITDRCKLSGIPVSFFGSCCQPPVYWLNPSCPYQMNGQNLIYNPKQQFSTDEENQAYQSVIDCLASGSTNCQANSTINSLIQKAKDKNTQCTNSCESNFQSCVTGCHRTVTDSQAQTDGPYQDSRANTAYRAAVQCVRNGYTYNCLRTVASYVATSWVHDIMQQAMNDVQNGTVWQPQAAQTHIENDPDCQTTCDTKFTACTKACPLTDDLQNKINAAASKATSDYQSAIKTPISMPEAKPLTSKFQGVEVNATKLNSDQITDQKDKKIGADELKKGLSDSFPVVNLQYSLGKVASGNALEAIITNDPTSTLPVDKVILTPNTAIDDGTLTVTIGDHTKPELFVGSGQARDKPDYDRPNVEPDYSLYDTVDFIRIDAKTKTGVVDFFNNFFSFYLGSKDLVAPMGGRDNPNNIPSNKTDNSKAVKGASTSKETNTNNQIVLLHYNKNTKHWDELPTEKSICDSEGGCRFVAESSGASTFAIVIKKPAPKKITIIIEWLVLILWAFAIFLFYRKFWLPISREVKSVKSKEEKSVIIKKLGFWEFVARRGIILCGSPIALLFMIFLMFGNVTSWFSVLIFINICGIIVGFLFGCIAWFFLTRQPKVNHKDFVKP